MFLSPITTRSFKGLVPSVPTRVMVAPILEKRPLPSKGVEHSGTTRKPWVNISPSHKQSRVSVKHLVMAFPGACRVVQD